MEWKITENLHQLRNLGHRPGIAHINVWSERPMKLVFKHIALAIITHTQELLVIGSNLRIFNY